MMLTVLFGRQKKKPTQEIRLDISLLKKEIFQLELSFL